MPELRKDPVTGRWVIISTDRAKRPSDFLRESVKIQGSAFCPFCYGNESKTPPEILAYGRTSGGPNSPGWKVRVVPNKFPALGIEGDLNREGEGMFDRMNGVGAHEIIIETPDHCSTLASLPERAIEDVLWAYRDRVLDLKNDKRLRYALIFKNQLMMLGRGDHRVQRIGPKPGVRIHSYCFLPSTCLALPPLSSV